MCAYKYVYTYNNFDEKIKAMSLKVGGWLVSKFGDRKEKGET